MIKKIINSIKWRFGYPVAAELLQIGSDKSIAEFYNDRITDCHFVTDPEHYEFPRFQWINSLVKGGILLEVGCGNGGMTELFSAKVDFITAMDISKDSLAQLEAKKIENIETIESLIENFITEKRYDWIVMSEVIEHLRNPEKAIKNLYNLLAPNGKLLITTPNGFWESNEHLKEFTADLFFKTVNSGEPDKIEFSYIRDIYNQRRWLSAVVQKSLSTHKPDNFYDRRKIILNRKNKSKN